MRDSLQHLICKDNLTIATYLKVGRNDLLLIVILGLNLCFKQDIYKYKWQFLDN